MENLSVSALIAACSALRCRYDFYIQEAKEGVLSDYRDTMLALAKDYEDYINEFEEYAKKLNSISYEK